MSDIVSLLKLSYKNNEKTIELVDDYFHIQGRRFHKETETPFYNSFKKIYYTLNELIFVYNNANKKFSDYKRECIERKINSFPMKEFIDTIQFLQGNQVTLSNYHESQAKSLDTSVQSQATKSDSLTYLNKNKRSFDYKDGLVGGEFIVPTLEVFEENKSKLKKIRENEMIPSTSSNNTTPLFDSSQLLKILSKSKDNEEKSKLSIPQNISSNTPKPPSQPIILVPNTLTSLINIYNIENFLASGTLDKNTSSKCVHPRNVMINLKNNKKKINFYREYTKGSSSSSVVLPTNYVIYDDPLLLTDKDWDNVVACFITNQSWQFRNFKFKNPIDFFQNVLGVFTYNEGKVVDPIVLSWNCKLLAINEHKPFVTAGASRDFWHLLDEYIKTKKPHLLLKN